MFAYGADNASMPVCYNGDLFTTQDIQQFTTQFPSVQTVMLGRGLLANPGLAAQAEGEKPVDSKTLIAFHNTLLERYQEILSGQRNVLFKMKELWVFLVCLFADGEPYAKKSARHGRYRRIRKLWTACLRSGSCWTNRFIQESK